VLGRRTALRHDPIGVADEVADGDVDLGQRDSKLGHASSLSGAE
jgi:hypothetical protein